MHAILKSSNLPKTNKSLSESGFRLVLPALVSLGTHKNSSLESTEKQSFSNNKTGTVSSLLVTCDSKINRRARCNQSKLTCLISPTDTQTHALLPKMILCCFSGKTWSQTENFWKIETVVSLKMHGIQHLSNKQTKFFLWNKSCL